MTTCKLCGEKFPHHEIMDHLRVMHPNEWGDGEISESLVEADDEPPAGMETARITIIRRITDDDLLDYVAAVDPEGEDLPLTEALGMMRLAEDTLIRDRMGEDE